MKRSTKTFNNLLFPLFAVGGFFYVYWIDLTGLAELELLLKLLVPTYLVGAYAILMFASTKTADDYEVADYYSESIYFLGFIYTLISLFIFAMKLIPHAEKDLANNALTFSLLYIGISVTTSLAGVLFRNMVKAAYLKRHPADTSSVVNQSIMKLTEYSEMLAKTYSGVAAEIQSFLLERKEEISLLSEKESKYIESLATFNDAVDNFCRRLSEESREISNTSSIFEKSIKGQESTLQSMSHIISSLSESVGRTSSQIENLDLSPLANDMSNLRGEISELDSVIDSLIGIIQLKVEKLG